MLEAPKHTWIPTRLHPRRQQRNPRCFRPSSRCPRHPSLGLRNANSKIPPLVSELPRLTSHHQPPLRQQVSSLRRHHAKMPSPRVSNALYLPSANANLSVLCLLSTSQSQANLCSWVDRVSLLTTSCPPTVPSHASTSVPSTNHRFRLGKTTYVEAKS